MIVNSDSNAPTRIMYKTSDEPYMLKEEVQISTQCKKQMLILSLMLLALSQKSVTREQWIGTMQ